MPRIIAGELGGRRFSSPPSDRTRPTSDRVRESVFARLEAWDAVRGLAVIDLYAGTGALGFEALSRGAASLVSIEAHARTARSIESAAHALGLDGRTRVLHLSISASSTKRSLWETPADLVFADPPYHLSSNELATIVENLASTGSFAPDALVVIERDRRSDPLELSDTFERIDTREIGDTRIEYVVYRGDTAPPRP